MIEPIRFNLMLGWIAMVAGAISGALIGLFFHKKTGWAATRRCAAA